MSGIADFLVKGKKAIVTGGAMGIGRACATALAKAGASVSIVDSNNEMGSEVSQTLKKFGVESQFIQCDVTDAAQVQAMVTLTVEHFGRIDIAVNCAGIAADSIGIEQPKEIWDKVIGVNLTGVWLCAQAEAKQMIKQDPMGGKIINIASAAARTASPNPAYCASKAGVVHLTRSLAMQLGANNINVNSISPGVLMSPMILSYTEALKERLREITPVGYIARPQDIHGPLLFLASSASDYVTGHDLLMDGGRTLSTWIEPIKRSTPARISTEEEIVELTSDLLRLKGIGI